MNSEFEECKQMLKECYEKYPVKTVDKLNKIIIKLYPESKKKHKKELYDKYYFIPYYICFALMLVIVEYDNNMANPFSLYFGVGLFISGLFLCLRTWFPCLFIFLIFGYCGFNLFLKDQVINILNSPILSDTGNTVIYTWLGVSTSLFLIGLILTFIYNFSDKVKKKKCVLLILLMCYLTAFAIIKFFPIFCGVI